MFYNTKNESADYAWQKAKLANLLMRDGKKLKAEKIVKEAMIYLQVKHAKSFSEILPEAVENSASIFHLKSRRKGAQRVKVPFVLSTNQQKSSGLRRLVKEARNAQGSSLGEKLGYTILQASKGQGKSVEEQRREQKEVKKNRGNLYLRW